MGKGLSDEMKMRSGCTAALFATEFNILSGSRTVVLFSVILLNPGWGDLTMVATKIPNRFPTTEPLRDTSRT